MHEVLRQEKKFLIDTVQYHRLRHRFSLCLQADRHDTGEGYLIRSLYFDSLDDRDFTEKEAGVELRRKIRLRSYGPDTPFALLEMKQKQGPLQKKRSLRLSRADASALCRGDYAPLLRQQDPFGAECFALMQLHCYRPRCIISYRRKAFVAKENRTRITLDHHIAGTESCHDLFASPLAEYPLLDSSLAVLEVKYNGFLLSYIKDMLAECRASESSVSKYCLGRAVSMHYTF